MSDDGVGGQGKWSWRETLVIGVVIMAIAGQMVWTGQKVSAVHVMIAGNSRRLDELERVGSP